LLNIIKHVFTQARKNAKEVGCHKYQCALTSCSLIFRPTFCTWGEGMGTLQVSKDWSIEALGGKSCNLFLNMDG